MDLNPEAHPGSAKAGGVDMTKPVLITVEASEASDSWGFVGVVKVGDYEAYRTIRAYTAPTEALGAARSFSRTCSAA